MYCNGEEKRQVIHEGVIYKGCRNPLYSKNCNREEKRQVIHEGAIYKGCRNPLYSKKRKNIEMVDFIPPDVEQLDDSALLSLDEAKSTTPVRFGVIDERLSVPEFVYQPELGEQARKYKDLEYPAEALRAMGINACYLLLDAGYAYTEIVKARYPAIDLRRAGVPARFLKWAGYLAWEAREGGYLIDELLSGKYSKEDVLHAGYTAYQLRLTKLYSDEEILRSRDWPLWDLINGFWDIWQQIKALPIAPETITSAVMLKFLENKSGK